ncbi:MAG: glycoside hydrolase family 3 protein [Gemmiger formicilis]|uniref:glycoside hydrolase family 3 protein n=1 Tax=Gemmiger formicilis TaxID=745368 RepID=UPI003995094F
MKRLLFPALLLTALTACTAAPAGTLPAAAPTPTPASTPAPTAAPAPADALTPEEKIGQLFIIRPDALDLTLPQETINDAKADGVTMLTDAMRETLQAYPVGGICQFGKNITDPEQLAQFNADLQAASRTPLFIAVDEEGGAVARLANHPAFDLPQYESAAAVGASGDPADACAMGQTIGAYLKEYGFNMDFAPDADVNTNPDNPIIGTRAFSSDAATAAEMAAAAADGLRTGGILPTLKHFPGHGDTAEDSHTALAVTYKTLDELQACELLPFAADTGLHAVMVGHIAAPNVTGDGTPATLSPQLVALIPDAENTLIVTDSLAMDAITAAYTPGEAAVQAFQAGCDVLLMPNSLPEAYAAVLEAVQNGTISEERLDRSVNKILLYKQQFAS